MKLCLHALELFTPNSCLCGKVVAIFLSNSANECTLQNVKLYPLHLEIKDLYEKK